MRVLRLGGFWLNVRAPHGALQNPQAVRGRRRGTGQKRCVAGRILAPAGSEGLGGSRETCVKYLVLA